MLQLRPVQEYLTAEASRFITHRTGMETSIGRVRVLFPNFVSVADVNVKDHHNQHLFNADKMDVLLTRLSFSNPDIYIDRIGLENVGLRLYQYKGEERSNLALFIERLAGELRDPERDPDKPPAVFNVGRLKVKNSSFINRNHNKPPGKAAVDFNDLDLAGVDADISNISVQGDLVNLRINRMRFADKSGFAVNHLSGTANISATSMRMRSLNIETNQSTIVMDVGFHFRDFSDFNDFVNRIYIRSDIAVTTLSTTDLGYFVPTFYQTGNRINLKGKIEGYVRHFETEHFQFNVGSTSFDGDLAMTGLPDFENTHITLSINHLVSDPNDIDRFIINNNGLSTSLELPSVLTDLGMVSVSGQFNGTYRDFYTDAGFTGSFGHIKADMQLMHYGAYYAMDGALSVQHVDVGKVVGSQDLGVVNMDAAIKGGGSSETWAMDINGMVHSVNFMGYNYRKVAIDGKLIDRTFSGVVGIEDDNIALDFNGLLDFEGSPPNYNFEAHIRNANLANLGLAPDTVRGLLSSKFSIDLQGDRLDNLAGLVDVEFADFTTAERHYQLDHLNLSIFSSPENRRKFIAIRSEIMNGDVHGNFNFNEIADVFETFVSRYIKAVAGDPDDEDAVVASADANDVHFDFSFGNLGNILELFTGQRIETEGLQVSGSFLSADQNLRLSGKAASIGLNDRVMEDWYLGVQTRGEEVHVQTRLNRFAISDTMELYYPSLEAVVVNDRVESTLFWHFDPANPEPDAAIGSVLNLRDYPKNTFTFTHGRVDFDNQRWRVNEGSSITWHENRLEVDNLIIYSQDHRMVVNGVASEDPASAILCRFKEMDLSWIDFLTVPHNIDLDGYISGTLTVSNLWDSPKVLADLLLTEFALNGDPMGSVHLKSLWDEQQKGMQVSADFIHHGNIGERKTAEINGYIYPQADEGQNFRLIADLDNFRINFLSNFLEGVTSDVRGFASGKLNLNGSFKEPELTGNIRVNARTLYFDYLNTRYSFSDSIVLTRNAILFNQIQLSDNNRLNLRDPYSATLNGAIRHRGFKDFSLDLSIRAQNFTFLNTTGQQDPMYFGRAMATGNVSIRGPVDDILINVEARTERFTQLEIPLVSASEVSRSSFIVFKEPVSERELDIVIPAQQRTLNQSSIRLNFDLQVTPEATIRLIFDPLLGDVIEGSGSGNIMMNINSNGEFELMGLYTIAKGDYIFNLENFISKRFSVRSGSTIRWTGNPFDAMIDIEAVYPVRASLAPLNPEDSARALQSVECVIHMTEKLFDPKIDFKIEFPQMTSFENERYQAMVRPNINYHFVSLLAIGRFVNTHSVQFADAGSSANIAGTSTTEMLVNQLSVWFSNISDELDIDFAYHPRSDLTTEQVEAIIRTQVLNDRLTIESKVGIGGGAHTHTNVNQPNNNMIGDILAEYRIDPEGRFRVRAYRRHNDQTVIYEGVHYTQGVGVFYRREFDSMGDLFRRRDRDRSDDNRQKSNAR